MIARKHWLVGFVLALVGVLSFVSVNAGREQHDLSLRQLEILPRLYEVPPFELTGVDGETFHSQSLAGKVWVADFIFTTCAGPCPVMSNRMAELHRAYVDDPNVAFVSISVDPKYDTPEVLAEYAERFEADPERWHFLTGPIEEIHTLSVEGFKVGSVDEPINHSVRFVLVDATGTVRGYYDGTTAESALQLSGDIGRLLEENTSRL